MGYRWVVMAGAALAATAGPVAAQSEGEGYPPPPPPGRVAAAPGVPALSPDETVWHLRAALNVAALACRDAGDEATAVAYGALLQADRVPLAAAHAAVQARYRLRRGAGAEAAYDDDMTRLYNFYASPFAHAAFCATARVVLDEARRVPAAALARFAPAALAAIDAPFAPPGADVPRGESERVVIATAAPVPLGPRGGGE